MAAVTVLISGSDVEIFGALLGAIAGEAVPIGAPARSHA
jgi:hypothetical protein